MERGYRKWRVPELTVRFNRRFCLNITQHGIKSTLTNHGFLSGRNPGLLTGERCIFTKRQQLLIVRWYRKFTPPQIAPILNKKFNTTFRPQQIRTYLHNRGITSGRDCTFKPGIIPWNYGTKGTGICKGNSGNFLKGHRPKNYKRYGTERITVDGYVQVKVHGKNPHTGYGGRWIEKHVLLWEKWHGKRPRGSAILFRDGNKRNFRRGNLVLVTRSELVRLNQDRFGKYPTELKPSVVALVKLKVKTFELRRNVSRRRAA
jgi:hypothetical protein